MNVTTETKITKLGVVCSECKTAIDDPELLDEARNTRWECPHCGAKHISLNDMLRRARVIESASEDDAPDEPEDGEECCKVGHMDPKELQRIHEEFIKRGKL